jgi:molecular chaperone DnaJ
MKDYYKILGLSPNCSQEDIKKAYRKLARGFHPDTCGKEDSSEFREVQEAYDAIGEKSKRNNYDRERRTQQQQSQNIPNYPFRNREDDFFYPFSFQSYFDQVLNQFLSDDLYISRYENISHQIELILTPEEARTGGVIPVEVPIRQSCPVCRGKGSNLFFFCDHCGGSGSISQHTVINIEIPPKVANLSQYTITIPAYGELNITILIR